MSTPLLATKLYIPSVRRRERVVLRPNLVERLNEGLRSGRKLKTSRHSCCKPPSSID